MLNCVIVCSYRVCSTLQFSLSKADGTTCSCGHYAVTVHPQLQVPCYPIPLPENVFLKLHGHKPLLKIFAPDTGENLSVQSREPTNSTHIRRRVWESNPSHIGGRRVLSPLCHPCTPCGLSAAETTLYLCHRAFKGSSIPPYWPRHYCLHRMVGLSTPVLIPSSSYTLSTSMSSLQSRFVLCGDYCHTTFSETANLN